MAVSSAQARFGLHPNPFGTLEELRREGLSTLNVGSCAPKGPEVRGCEWYADCPFNQLKMGGFKDQGPRYIGYALIIPDEDTGKRDSCRCFDYVQVLEKRRKHGINIRLQGFNGEIIRVIAQQGETIKRRQVVQVDVNDSSKGHKIVIEDHVVPTFPRPGSETDALTYQNQLVAEELKRQQLEEAVLGSISDKMLEEMDTKPEEKLPTVEPVATAVPEPKQKAAK